MKKWIWVMVALPVVLAGCNLFNRDFSREVNTGSLVLLLDGSTIATKTIAPPNMTATKYDISMTHTTSGATISEADWTSGVFTRNGLETGVWTVSITAKDSGGNDIGAISGDVSGTDTFTILAGEVISKAVSIVPLVGKGGLSLSLTWPEGTVNSPVTMAAWLKPETATDAYTNHPITFTVIEADRTATYAVPLAPGLDTGYYTLVVQLFGDGVLEWGWAESVRIVSGVTTTGALELVAGTGGLTLNVTVDMENPIQIGWGTTPPTSITVGGNLAVTAVPALAAATGYAFSYQWYLEGAALTTEMSAALSYGPTYGDTALAVGEYAVSVVVTETQSVAPFAVRTISSNGFSFSVVLP